MRKLSFIIIGIIFSTTLYAQSPHGKNLTIDCGDCHTSQEQGWQVNVSAMKFSHKTTGFELTGEHKFVDCASCHENLVFSNAKPECSSCHMDVHENTVGLDCARCHEPASWVVSNITNIHNQSRFPLLGAHSQADCKQCHNTPGSKVNFEPLGTDCYSCHSKNYMAAKNPNHVQGNFSKDCSTCHSPDATDWSFSAVDHSFFPLTGGHALNDCSYCHKGGEFGDLSSDCYSCHSSDYAKATSPNHSQLNFPTDCSQCHSLNPGWKPVDFNHDSFFQLIGAHHTIRNQCSKCHLTENFADAPTDCYGCHQSTYEGTTNPDHQSAGFPTDCQQCHSQEAWSPATFNHDDIFALTGAHDNIRNDCQKCHTTNDYSAAPTDCYGCHADNYNNTSNPNHTQLNFSTDCQTCHTTTAWTPASFDHDGQYFPIYSGKHNGEWNQCSDCHTDVNNYAVFSCITCHEHNQSDMNSEHSEVNGYVYESNACYSCHPTGSGEGDDGGDGAFNHINTAFPLIGAHQGNSCTDCHVNSFKGTSMECQSCHLTDFQNATNPNHQTLGFNQDCSQCHSSNPDWPITQFPVHDQIYALTGAHGTIAADCSKCHTSANYSDTPKECVGCHQTDYNGAANPDHQNLSLPTDCSQCHTTDPGWSPAEFTIHNQFYQLNGAHAAIAVDCAKCHTGANYADAPGECIGCHQTDYQNTNNPNHAAANFPNTCTDCHTENAWTPATFDHDGQYFPIYSGKHNGEWNVCSDCHNNSSDYAVFTCIDCHEHNQSKMNSEHSGVSGYSYTSSACYDCHPTGGEGDGDGDDGRPIKIKRRK